MEPDSRLNEADLIFAITSPLRNGDELPRHPASTTSLEIVHYGIVRDASDGVQVRGGLLHNSEIISLAANLPLPLGHLYAYVIRNNHIYHTREAVVIEVACKRVADDLA